MQSWFFFFLSSAEHYVFPEDRAAADLEVRTVEEESLFRVAFPEIVESYLRSKALAKENKTKSKTPKFITLTWFKCSVFGVVLEMYKCGYIVYKSWAD